LKAPNIAVNKADCIGRTPLMAAAINGRANAVTALLKAGADPKLTANGGFYDKQTAQDCAKRLKQEEVLSALEKWAELQEANQQQSAKLKAEEQERAPTKAEPGEAAASAPSAAAPDAESTLNASAPAAAAGGIKTEPKPAAESSAGQSASPATTVNNSAAPDATAAVKTEERPQADAAAPAAAADAGSDDPAAV
jgi:hypothetical protein